VVTLAVTKIDAIKTFATADGIYDNGWSWKFSITVPTSQTSLYLKFNDWINGSNAIAVANNMRYYTEQGDYNSAENAITIAAAGTYPNTAITLNADLDADTAGRQIEVYVEAKVPIGSAGGSYSTQYGVKSQ